MSKIDRKELLALHNPVLQRVDTESPLTVGNGELGFTADVTGMQSMYGTYQTVPLCTMSQWGWHTAPVSEERYAYTLDDLVMTEYPLGGRTVVYPKRKMPGNEAVYDWLRQNPHRLNLGRIGLTYNGGEICPENLSGIYQELNLYEGILHSRFCLDGKECQVETACDNRGRDVIGFRIRCKELESQLAVRVSFPYGSPDISASDWNSPQKHRTECVRMENQTAVLRRTLDRDCYQVRIQTNGRMECEEAQHQLLIEPEGEELWLTVEFAAGDFAGEPLNLAQVLADSRAGFCEFWEKGGIIRLNRSRNPKAMELERRILLSQYLMAVNSSGSRPPQETGLTVNSWYGKMHLEMYFWHCGWLPLWGHTDLLERSLAWYLEHLPEARENAARNGYRGARWPKMIASEGIDCPSPVAPLLVWQQPHVIYMLETAYRQNPDPQFLKKYWPLVKETAEFMADFVVWNEETGCYDIAAPVIPVQECHKETETHNPAFEVEYWHLMLKTASDWAKRLDLPADESWREVSEHMAGLKEKDGAYLAHEWCEATFTDFNRDHPSMLGAYGLLGSERVSPEVMKATLHKVLECWNYPTLWGWDFAMMAMTAVRVGEPELAVDILLMETEKNHYLTSGNNMQKTRKDLPLYLPGNGSLLLAAAMMTAGYEGCGKAAPGFPDDGSWK
ncbi:MAG: glycoside hydrolase family 65, partial [Lachnospiraceae bacterium]|nr:glycoside hydrolase family 65 [Lachnospiraceae bacterium]